MSRVDRSDHVEGVRRAVFTGYVVKRLLWAFAVGALAIGAGALVVHLPEKAPVATGERTPVPETASVRVLEKAVALIAEESRGALPRPVVEAAPLPPTDAGPPVVKARRSQAPPDGYSQVGFDGEMAKAPMGDPWQRRQREDDGPDWLGSPTSIETLVAQASAAGREWSFGWLQLAEDARRADLASSLEGTGAAIVGSAGGLLRMRLPGDQARLEAIAALPGVDGLGTLPAENKLRAFDRELAGRPDHEPMPVFVTLMAADTDGRWKSELAALGAIVGRYDPAIRVYAANVTRGVLDALAAADFVLALEPIGIVEPAHDTAVPAMGADVLRIHGDRPGIFTGAAGASVPIGVMDTGLNINHPDIAEHRSSICGVNLFWFAPDSNDQDLWADARHHGTHVTGTIAGNGFLAPRFAGMAPSVSHIRLAKVFHYDAQLIPGTTIDIMNRAMDFLAETSGCAGSTAIKPLIVNMSLGEGSTVWIGREVGARKLDATVWGQRQLYVVAQANDGPEGFSNYAGAKNSLSVGAAFDDGAVAPFSGHGPTGDGRLAPQVVATGVGVCSPEGNGKGAGYVCLQGTSMAAPSVAGVAALLLDANPDYKNQPALARARLMASAIRPDVWLGHANAVPLTNTGGPGNLQAQNGLGKVSARLAVLDRDQADGWAGGGAVAEFKDESEYAYSDIEVPEGASRLDVVLTWDEPPTEAIATPVLNDLDLWLDRDADCDDGPCGEQSSASRIDNVEWIVVRDPAPGTYRAKVVPRRIYTAPPKAAISWMVIRGASTPELEMTVEGTPLDEIGEERTLELSVEISADAYVAAGVRLHLECRGENTDCDALTVAGATVGREDGLTRDASRVVRASEDLPRNARRKPIGMASRISLGEIAVGETQTITLDAVYSGDEPVHLYLTASAWNANAVSHAVAILPPGSDDDSEVADPLEKPANGLFASPVVHATGEGSMTVDLLRAVPESGEPLLHPDYGRPLGSLWYKWTAPSTDLVRFSVSSASRGSMDAYLDVYRGDRIAGLDHIVANRRTEVVSITAEGDPILRTIFTDAVFFAEAGETYRVRVAHGGTSVPLVLRWRQGPRPTNDDFLNADVLSGGKGSIDGTNLGATLESGESFGPLAATTWYRWTAPEDGAWRFKADTDHLLRVVAFTGTDLAGLRLVSGRPTDTAFFVARGGDEYRIAVASRDAYVSGGSYGMSWEKVRWLPDSGDLFAQAGTSSVSFRLDRHTVEPGEPEASGVRTRWWSWNAPDTGRFTWRLSSLSTELTVAAFSGDALENLQLVGSTGPDVTSREFSFPAVQGERYWLSVGWPSGDFGAYVWPSASGFLFRGPTPRNDELEGAIGLGSTRGLTAASNAYATTAAGELAEQLGHSTLWWTYEAPTAGWYEFQTTHTRPALAVFEIDAAGSLREISRSRDGKVVFHAQVGKRYAIRASTVSGSTGDLGLYWMPTDAPAWLRFAGSFADAVDADGDAVRLIDAGSLAIDGDGGTLYAASAFGLTVFERDADTGGLSNGKSIEDDLARSLLVHDQTRDRLIANRCGTWRVYTGLDGAADAIEGSDLTVEGDPASCGRRLFIDPEGTFLYRVASELGIEVFAVEDDGLSHEGTTQLDAIKDAVIAPNGAYIYGVHPAPTSRVRTFRRNQETGLLTRQSRFWRWRVPDMDTLAIADNERLFVIQSSTGNTAMLDVRNGAPSSGVAAGPQSDELSHQLARPFEFAAGRSGTSAVDVFGTSVAAGLEIQQREVDLLANGQPDRFGKRVPLFGAPSGLASSPDGRHVYLASYEHGIVAFERLGAGVEPEDPYVRLGILAVSSGTVSFGAEDDSEECIAVTDLEHDGVTYTVASSEWQWRANADWPWSELGTAATGEVCPHTPSEPGHYRLVVEMEVDGETRLYTSNVLVQDDHGDSHDEAAFVEVPSVTAGWLEPGDRDYFGMKLTESGQLTVRSEGWINAEGRLLDGDGDSFAIDSDSGTDYNFRIVRDLDAGTYFVRIHERFARPGAYAVHVEFEPHVPDLVVESASVSDASPDAGASFTLKATVRNQGDAESPATTLRYYRSVDDEIATTDTEVGTIEVDAVVVGGTTELSIDLSAPTESGTYHYGACVDAVERESDATNNCSAAVALSVD